ncbi:roundabout-like protein 1, partial [Elysia marginata]
MEWRPRVPIDPVFLKTNSNVTVREGGRAELPCTIQHLGTKKVAWRHVDKDRFVTIGKHPWSPEDDVKIHHIKHREDLDDWTLVLPKVKKTDAGLYECQLTASAGFHTMVRLNVV